MPYTSPDTHVTLFAPGLYTTPTAAPTLALGSIGVRFFLNVSALLGGGGTYPPPVVYFTLQEVDPVSGNGIQLAAWESPVVSSAGLHELTIYPNITASANQAVSDCIHGDLLVAIWPSLGAQVQLSLCAVPIW